MFKKKKKKKIKTYRSCCFFQFLNLGPSSYFVRRFRRVKKKKKKKGNYPFLSKLLFAWRQLTPGSTLKFLGTRIPSVSCLLLNISNQCTFVKLISSKYRIDFQTYSAHLNRAETGHAPCPARNAARCPRWPATHDAVDRWQSRRYRGDLNVGCVQRLSAENRSHLKVK